MPPVPSELHVDRYLTNLSVAFAQDERDFISNKVFPVVPVRKQSDNYVIYNRSDFWREGNVHERPLGGRLDTADWGFTSGTYFCRERGLAHKIDDRQYANADDPIDLRRQAMELLTSSVMIDAERRWMTSFWGTSIWTTDKVGGGTDFTSVAAPNSGTPLATIDEYKETVKELTALMPNTLVLGPVAFRTCRNHDHLKDVFKYTRTGIIDEDLMALSFGVDRLFIPRAVSNAAAEGLAASLGFMIPSGTDVDALLLYAAPRPGLNTPSAGYTFAWTGLIPGLTNTMGGVIMTGRDDFAHSDHFEIRQADDQRVVSADLGLYLDAFTA